MRKRVYARRSVDVESRMRVENPTKAAAQQAALRAVGAHGFGLESQRSV